MKVFYHADLDGKCSAAIIRYFLSEMTGDIRLFPYDHGREIPTRQIENGETVFFVDCCFRPMQEMKELALSYDVIWIDHHISSMQEAERLNFNPDGIREVGKAACELTWEYICRQQFQDNNPQIPLGVQMVGRRDVWDLNFSKDLHSYHNGLSALDNDPRTDRGMKTWSELVFSTERSHSEQIISDGRVIEQYLAQQNKHLMNSYAFPTRIRGLRALALNRQFVNSSVFESLWDNKKYDLMIAFAKFKDSKLGFCWKVSLYTDKKGIDVSEIAVQYGGGGHTGAAGFTIQTLPFRIENETCTD